MEPMDSIGQEGVEVDYGDDPADVHQVGWRPCRGDSSPGLACPAGPPPAGSLPLPTPALPPSQNGHEDAEEEDQAGADEGAEEGVAGEGGAAAEEAGMEQQQPGEHQQQQGGQQQQQAQAPQQPAAAAKPPPPQRPPGGADSGVREEWHLMDIPESWRPIPMIRVRAGRAGALLCLPACERTASRRPEPAHTVRCACPPPCIHPTGPRGPLPLCVQIWGLPKEATEQEVMDVLAGAGVSARSVVFDPKQESGKGKVAFVRFHPPPLPWTDEGRKPDGSPLESDIQKIAEEVVMRLKAADPPLELRGEALHVEKAFAEVRRSVGSARWAR